MRQNRRPPTSFDICQPSPKNLSEAPSFSFFSPSSPAKQAEPGLVSTHWPTRLRNCRCSLSLSMVNSSTATPGRPSSVSSGDSVRSMPASAPQAITEVAKPVMVRAAISAHSSDGAVMMIRVPTMGKASAKVSTMVTPLIFNSDMARL